MALIWGFSTDAASAEHTLGVVARILGMVAPWATPEHIALVNGVVRKLGHFTEYAALAALWFRAFRARSRLRPAPGALAALAISVAWAITDEVHQVFVPSRTPSPFDVALDAAGALVALLVLCVRSDVTL